MLFNKIIGNEDNKKLLINSVKSKSVLHSYLFFGVDGIGKKIFAKEFAKMILCNNKDGIVPCNKCKQCIEFDSNNNPDFFLVEPDGNSIKIDQIRYIQKTMLEKPIEGSKKVYIINDSHTMTKEAQNCILKTLEEPQDSVVIILIASNENAILPTVKSRCTKIYFKELNKSEILDYISRNYEENILDNNLLKLCNGSISKVNLVLKKLDVMKQVEHFISQIQNCNELEFIQNNQLLYDNKDDIYLILDYIYILLFEKIVKENTYVNAMKIVEYTKLKLTNSNNYDMTIDNMLIRMWEEVNEKDSRS